MRIDFGNKHQSVKFKLDPGELEIELKTGNKITFKSVSVDFWDQCVIYKSSDNIPLNEVELSDTSRVAVEHHANHTVKEILGVPDRGPDGWEIDWSLRWCRYPGDDKAEVYSRKPKKGCYIIMHLHQTE